MINVMRPICTECGRRLMVIEKSTLEIGSDAVCVKCLVKGLLEWAKGFTT